MNTKYFFTYEQLKEAVSNSLSFSSVMKKLNIPHRGRGSYLYIKKAISENNIDISHFQKYSGIKEHINNIKVPINDFLSNKKYIPSNKLKNRLIKDGILEYKCQHCKQTMWFDLPIPLELHHIDHNHENNNLTNLMLLCPNCHSYIHKQDSVKKIKSTYKRDAPRFKIRKVERPDYETLRHEIAETNYCAVGRKYGVSDNAVRKWIKSYEKQAGASGIEPD